MPKQTEQKEEIVICKHCGKPEYWGAMRWLSGWCACRNCYRSLWEDQNHKRYTWDDLDGPRPSMEEYKEQEARKCGNTNGAKAVPVSNQADMEKLKKRGYKPVIVSEAKRDVILESELYEEIRAENAKEKEKARPLYDRFCEFAEKIEDRLEESEVTTLYEFLDELSELEEKKEE